MPDHVRNFNNVPDGSTIELEIETDDAPWAAVARVTVSSEPSRRFRFSVNNKGPRGFQLASPKVAFIDGTITFQEAATLKAWARARRPDGTIHHAVSREIAGQAGDTVFQHFVVVSELQEGR